MDLMLLVQCALLVVLGVCLWFLSPWALGAVASVAGFAWIEWRGRS